MEPTKPGGSFELVTVRQSHPDAVAMLEEYADYLASSVPGGFDCATDPRVPPGAFEAPHGRFLVAYDSTPTGGEPLGCGALRLLEPELRRWHYAANVMALRDVVAAQPEAAWEDR